MEGEMTEEDTNELIRYETVTSPGPRTYWKIHFAQGSDAGQTELCEVMKTPLGRVGRAALALIGKFPSEEVSANLHRLKEVMETGRVGGKTMRRVIRTCSVGLALTAIALGVSPGLAQNVEQVKPVFEHVIPNVEGKSMIAVVVTYPPGGKSLAHHHARSAFIYAHVLSGAIRSQVDDEPAKVYQVGEGFYEMPGSHHRISENASDSNPASLLAVFVVDSKDKPLTIPDKK